jgi:PEP-CTERM motif
MGIFTYNRSKTGIRSLDYHAELNRSSASLRTSAAGCPTSLRQWAERFFSWSVAPGTTVGGLNPADLVLSVTTTPVPEPSTWAIMLAGFAGLGFLSYRASRKTTSAAA